MKKEFKLSDWRAEMFGEGVYPESKVKELMRLLKEEMCRCKTMVGEGKKCYACRNIDKLSGFKEDGGEE